VSKDIKKSFNNCFSKYSKSDTWHSLIGMIELFERLSYEVTMKMNVEYPEESISQIQEYIERLYANK
jgi:hypothetical protein